MLSISSAYTLLQALAPNQSTRRETLNEDLAHHLAKQAMTEPRRSFIGTFLAGLRARREARMAARHHAQAVARLAQTSPHLLDDLGLADVAAPMQTQAGLLVGRGVPPQSVTDPQQVPVAAGEVLLAPAPLLVARTAG